MVIDATAEPGVFNYLCAAVAISKKPMVWAEVFGGGFGGLIARYRPGGEPDPPRCAVLLKTGAMIKASRCHDQRNVTVANRMLLALLTTPT